MASKAAPATAAKTPGNGLEARASTTAPSIKSSSRAVWMARGNRTVEAPAVSAMSCPRAASMLIMTASGAGLRLRCRLSMLVIIMGIIGVGVRAMIIRIVRLARCILIFRRGRRVRMGSRLLVRMDRLGTVRNLSYVKCGATITDGFQVVAKWSIIGWLRVRRRWRLDTSRPVLVVNHQAFAPSAVLEVSEGSFFLFHLYISIDGGDFQA